MAERHCPVCGEKLKFEKSERSCGSITYYRCPGTNCGKHWLEDQRGIVGRPINLMEADPKTLTYLQFLVP